MKITAEFNSNEELLSFISTFGTKNFKPEQGTIKSKPAAVVEDKKEKEIPEVEAEIVSKEQPKGETVDAKIVQTEPDPAEDKKKDEVKITKEMVRAVFTKIIKAGKQKEAKTLTSKYGASKLPDVKEEDYAAIYKEAEGLL